MVEYSFPLELFSKVAARKPKEKKLFTGKHLKRLYIYIYIYIFYYFKFHVFTVRPLGGYRCYTNFLLTIYLLYYRN